MINLKKGLIIGKRQLVLAVLVLALSGAVFLNWKLADTNQTSANATSSAENLGNAKYVANLTSGSTESDYFTNARGERKEARDETIAELKEIMNNAKADEEAKKSASESAVKVAQNVEKESAIETLIKAKDFEDCVVVIGDNDISVVVKSDELSASQTMMINDIVSAQTGLTSDKIKIMNVK